MKKDHNYYLEVTCLIACYKERQERFQKVDYCKEKSKDRYKIEVKISELIHRHGRVMFKTPGLLGMEMQEVMGI